MGGGDGFTNSSFKFLSLPFLGLGAGPSGLEGGGMGPVVVDAMGGGAEREEREESGDGDDNEEEFR